MTIVIDASIATAWCLKDEASPLADTVLGMLATDDALAPAIWPMEVANSLLTAERAGRITEAELPTVINWLSSLPISVQTISPGPTVNEILAIARLANLSAYDASYVHLADTTGLPLATIDGPLRTACEKIGVRAVAP